MGADQTQGVQGESARWRPGRVDAALARSWGARDPATVHVSVQVSREQKKLIPQFEDRQAGGILSYSWAGQLFVLDRPSTDWMWPTRRALCFLRLPIQVFTQQKTKNKKQKTNPHRST